MVSTLTRVGTGGYSYSAIRSFDAWGNIRLGALTGDPKGRYCATLGHKQDDESGLVYMRARYYEPTSGRFLSEDFDHQGSNWFSYCANDPVNRADQTGRDWNTFALFLLATTLIFVGTFILLIGVVPDLSAKIRSLDDQIQDALKAVKALGWGPERLGITYEALEDSAEVLESLQTARAGALWGRAAAALAGYMMTLIGLVLDIELAGSGYDATSTATALGTGS